MIACPLRSIVLRPRLACLGLALLATSLGGCTRFLASDHGLQGWFGEPTEIPNRMSTLWSDTTLQQPGQAGVRGVGGRVMFYTAQQEAPIRVDGTFAVYLYDKSVGKNNNPAKPARKFVFPADGLATHYSESSLGHSYSFWLPWGETDGPAKQLTLIARFEPIGGGAILSDPAEQYLPGLMPDSPLSVPDSPSFVPDSPSSVPDSPSFAPDSAGSSSETTGQPSMDLAPGDSQAVQPAGHVTPLPTARPGGSAARPLETITIEIPPAFIRAPSQEVRRETAWQEKQSAIVPPGGLQGSIQNQESGRLPPSNRLDGPGSPTATRAGVESSTGSPPPTPQAQTASKPRLAADPRRTRRRLEAWLSARRPSPTADQSDADVTTR